MMKVKACLLAMAVCTMLAGAAQAESGLASIYGNRDGYAGKKTASGDRMNPHALTAAHRSLPFGSRVRVTNRKNGRSAIVRISDRGPFVRGRIIDVTPAVARALGFSGLAPVSISRVMS
jgi:rare lipoprotein A